MNRKVHNAVFAPDLLAGAFSDACCRRVLSQWRDGSIILVLNRDLLARYVRILCKLGVEGENTQRWALWFASSEKVRFVPHLVTNGANGWEICRTISKSEPDCSIISWRLPEPEISETAEQPVVFTAEEWVRKFG